MKPLLEKLDVAEMSNENQVRQWQSLESFCSRFEKWRYSTQIQHIPTPSYTPEYNGVAKCFNLTVQEMQRSYLLDSRLEGKHWAEALQMAVHVYNQLPSSTKNTTTDSLQAQRGEDCHH